MDLLIPILMLPLCGAASWFLLRRFNRLRWLLLFGLPVGLLAALFWGVTDFVAKTATCADASGVEVKCDGPEVFVAAFSLGFSVAIAGALGSAVGALLGFRGPSLRKP